MVANHWYNFVIIIITFETLVCHLWIAFDNSDGSIEQLRLTTLHLVWHLDNWRKETIQKKEHVIISCVRYRLMCVFVNITYERTSRKPVLSNAPNKVKTHTVENKANISRIFTFRSLLLPLSWYVRYKIYISVVESFIQILFLYVGVLVAVWVNSN